MECPDDVPFAVRASTPRVSSRDHTVWKMGVAGVFGLVFGKGPRRWGRRGDRDGAPRGAPTA